MDREKEEGFDRFLEIRIDLIEDYAEGNMSKTEFLEGNFRFLKKLNIKPFKEVDSFKKGMYNYQYYNVLAKYYNSKALSTIERDYDSYNYYKSMKNLYYNEKDKATMKLLDYISYKNIEAYFIEMESETLDNQIFEITLLDFEKAILHSKSYLLLKKLRDKGVFISGKKESRISEYINEKY